MVSPLLRLAWPWLQISEAGDGDFEQHKTDPLGHTALSSSLERREASSGGDIIGPSRVYPEAHQALPARAQPSSGRHRGCTQVRTFPAPPADTQPRAAVRRHQGLAPQQGPQRLEEGRGRNPNVWLMPVKLEKPWGGASAQGKGVQLPVEQAS